MPPPFFEPVKINIVEDRRWKKLFDFEGAFGEASFNYMVEAMKTLPREEVLDLAFGILNTGKRVHYFTREEEDAIWEAFQNRDEDLYQFRRAIMDAFQQEYEVAAMPDDEDIKWAIERATGDLARYDYDYIADYEALQEALPALEYKDSGDLVWDLLKGTITLKHQPGDYDRFLIYNPPSRDFIKRLKRAFGDAPAGAFEWAPPVNLTKHKEFRKELNELMANIKDNFINNFFHEIEMIMDNTNLENRMDFRKQWREIMFDPSNLKAAREAIYKVIKKAGKE